MYRSASADTGWSGLIFVSIPAMISKSPVVSRRTTNDDPSISISWFNVCRLIKGGYLGPGTSIPAAARPMLRSLQAEADAVCYRQKVRAAPPQEVVRFVSSEPNAFKDSCAFSNWKPEKLWKVRIEKKLSDWVRQVALGHLITLGALPRDRCLCSRM